MSKKKFDKRNLFKNKAVLVAVCIAVLALIFVGVFFLTTVIFENVTKAEETTDSSETADTTTAVVEKTTEAEKVSVYEIVTEIETTTKKQAVTTTAKAQEEDIPGNTPYPYDDASWKLICLNKNRYIGSSVEKTLNLRYVAGSGERMDSRAAAAYERMYDAAANDGIYLTPCSGYRSYSTQKRLYYEFYNQYINQGYSSDEAHALTSKRRNPPGSSEHNIGICMDIICASSSANFQNTAAFAWLDANAHNYGFILRYPENKVSVTGVKFEPWHWRYVGVENAASIKFSGLCLEEYLGLA